MYPRSNLSFDYRPGFKVRKRTLHSQMRWNKSEMTRNCKFCSERTSGKKREFMDTSQDISSSLRRDNDSSGWNGSSFPMQGKCPRIPERFIWLALKRIIFVLCITCFLYQSTKFCIHYYSYPTTIGLATITPKIIIKPAITFCNFNYFNRTYLCKEHPEFCEKPEDSDLKDYCLKNPAICIGDTSDLLLPKKNMSDSTIQEFHKVMLDIQLTHNISQNQSNTWGWSVFTESNMSTILVLDPDVGLNALCYSSNLHTDDSEEPEIFESTLVDPMYKFELLVPAEEAIFIKRPTITFSIHSPYLLENNTMFKDKLNLGSSYDINIRLEEQHFLPSPFLTDCMDYHDLWEANGRNGPRSQNQCKKLCWEPYYEICEGCDDDSLVFEKPEICTRENSPCNLLKLDEIPKCEKKCKSDCRKLKYHFTLRDRTYPLYADRKEYRDRISVIVFLDDTEVTVISHNPLYSKEELFGYIGGLMGCWLGISIFSCVKFFKKIWYYVRLKWKLRSTSKRSLLTRQRKVRKSVCSYHRNM